MIGISKTVAEQFPADRLAVWFSRDAHLGEVRCRYARNADESLTCWLPSSRHMSYVSKGWLCVEIDESSIPAADRAAIARARGPEVGAADAAG